MVRRVYHSRIHTLLTSCLRINSTSSSPALPPPSPSFCAALLRRLLGKGRSPGVMVMENTSSSSEHSPAHGANAIQHDTRHIHRTGNQRGRRRRGRGGTSCVGQSQQAVTGQQSSVLLGPFPHVCRRPVAVFTSRHRHWQGVSGLSTQGWSRIAEKLRYIHQHDQ